MFIKEPDVFVDTYNKLYCTSTLIQNKFVGLKGNPKVYPISLGYIKPNTKIKSIGSKVPVKSKIARLCPCRVFTFDKYAVYDGLITYSGLEYAVFQSPDQPADEYYLFQVKEYPEWIELVLHGFQNYLYALQACFELYTENGVSNG